MNFATGMVSSSERNFFEELLEVNRDGNVFWLMEMWFFKDPKILDYFTLFEGPVIVFEKVEFFNENHSIFLMNSLKFQPFSKRKYFIQPSKP